MVTRDILDLSLAELEAWCAERDAPRYRAAQIAAWIYQRGARDFAVMTNLSRPLREDLAAELPDRLVDGSGHEPVARRYREAARPPA